MFQDGSMDNMQFQYKILKFQKNSLPAKNQTKSYNAKTSVNNTLEEIKEIPSINDLKNRVDIYTMHVQKENHASVNISWNQMFYDIINLCDLKEKFTL